MMINATIAYRLSLQNYHELTKRTATDFVHYLFEKTACHPVDPEKQAHLPTSPIVFVIFFLRNIPRIDT